ncbi:hypothetical protein FHG87_010005 [Trinorchestia longiramus]|nr:hypothetical protein FHG87_010005 [Trinorchestia longiramus]
MQSPTGFSTITWLQRNPNLDSEEHSIFHKQRCMASKESRLHSLGVSIWSIWDTRVLATPYTSLQSLKAKLRRECEAIPHDQIRTASGAFVNRLKAIVCNKGGYIE